jgi:uncharacterized membrane protein
MTWETLLSSLAEANWEIFLASFAGSLIELVEILGIVLVVGKLAGWRNAIVGASAGMGLTLIVSLVLGKSLTLVPVDILKIVAGGFLLAFGQGWMRSVIRYYGGVPKPLGYKDEEDEIQEQLEKEGIKASWNWLAVIVAFKSSLLESIEVAIAVVTLGATGGKWIEAISGAIASTVGLIVIAFLLKAPLKQVPVKIMKFAAAMLLMGFGTYWLGEGLKVHWPTGSLALLWLPIFWGSLMAGTAALLRWRIGLQKQEEIVS